MVEKLAPVLEHTEAAADTMGHIWYHHVVDTYTQACTQTHQRDKARRAQESLLALFKARQVVPSVIGVVEKRVQELT